MTHDPQQDLAYIRQVMEQTRRYTLIKGDYFIVWGLLICLWLSSNAIALLMHRSLPVFELLALVIIVGWAHTLWANRQATRYEPVAGYAGRMVGLTWAACGICMMLVIFVGIPFGGVNPASLGGIMAVFMGLGVFMTGVLSGMTWFRNLGLGWWAGAVALFTVHGIVGLWIGPVLLLVLFMAPGVVLNLQARRLRAARL